MLTLLRKSFSVVLPMFLTTLKNKIHSLIRKEPDLSQRMSDEEINRLPSLSYEGEVKVIRDQQALVAAAAHLGREEVLGFDTETRPSFWKGRKYPPALVQLAGKEAVFIFQLKHTGLPAELCALLANPAIIKAGVALKHDVGELRHLAPFNPAGFVDLGDLARKLGLKNHGLRGMAGVLLGFRIPKGGTRTSNWAAESLSPAQIRYAATDAWVGRELYLRLRDL